MQACCFNIPSNLSEFCSYFCQFEEIVNALVPIGEVNCSEFWWFETAQYAQYAHCTMCNALACITIERASQWWLDRTTGSSVTMVWTLTPSEPGQTTDMQPATKPELRLISITGQDTTGCLPPKEHTMEYNQPKSQLFSLKVDKVNFNQTDRMIWAESQIYRKRQKLKSYCVPDSERLTVRHVAKSIPDDIS